MEKHGEQSEEEKETIFDDRSAIIFSSRTLLHHLLTLLKIYRMKVFHSPPPFFVNNQKIDLAS